MIKAKSYIYIILILLTFTFSNSVAKSKNYIKEYKQKGQKLYNQSKYDSSLLYYYQALTVANKDFDKATIYSDIGNVYEDLSNYNKALNAYNQSLEYYKKLSDKQGVSSALNQIGNIYYRWSDFEKSIKYYEQGLKIRKEINDKSGIPSSLNNIANIYYSWGKYEKALENYLYAYELKKQTSDKNELPSYVINIGSAYLSLKDYKNAEKYYNKALKMAKADNNSHIISTCYINFGVLNFENKNLTKAIEYYNKAYEIILNYGSKLEKAYVLRNIGETYIELNQYDKAKKYLQESLDVAKTENINSLIAEIYMFLYKIEDNSQNYKQALDYYIKSKNLNDSIFNKQSSEKLNELQSKYEYEKKENEIKQKNLEISQKQKQLQLQKFWFISISIFILILALIIYLSYRHKTTKKRIKLENELNQQMQKALSAQMNPHFISNALNSIQRYFLNNEIEIANEYLADFGTLIRTILEHSRKSQISVAKEIKSIELYLSLEALRLENKFVSEIIIAPEIDTKKVLIPPIILQPYIENAIWHGIAPLEINGNIKIKFSIVNNYLVCIIEDDGIGINKSKEIKKQFNNKHKSFGMNINNERITLLNKGNKIKFSVKIIDLSEIDNNLHGTKVEIKMPYAKN